MRLMTSTALEAMSSNKLGGDADRALLEVETLITYSVLTVYGVSYRDIAYIIHVQVILSSSS